MQKVLIIPLLRNQYHPSGSVALSGYFPMHTLAATCKLEYPVHIHILSLHSGTSYLVLIVNRP